VASWPPTRCLAADKALTATTTIGTVITQLGGPYVEQLTRGWGMRVSQPFAAASIYPRQLLVGPVADNDTLIFQNNIGTAGRDGKTEKESPQQ
jgi:hypothetical protein